MKLTEDDKRRIVNAVSVHLCLIETGDPVLRAADVEAQNRGKRPQDREPVRALGLDQMREILALEDLRKRVMMDRP